PGLLGEDLPAPGHPDPLAHARVALHLRHRICPSGTGRQVPAPGGAAWRSAADADNRAPLARRPCGPGVYPNIFQPGSVASRRPAGLKPVAYCAAAPGSGDCSWSGTVARSLVRTPRAAAALVWGLRCSALTSIRPTCVGRG